MAMVEDRLVNYGYTRTLTEAAPCEPTLAESEAVEDMEMPVTMEEANEECGLLEVRS